MHAHSIDLLNGSFFLPTLHIHARSLILAAHFGNLEWLETSIARGTNLDLKDDYNGRTALMWAAIHGHIECLQVLINAGAQLNMQGNDGRTALISAASYRHAECLQALINAGAQLDIQDNDGLTALIKAVYWGNSECLQILINGGAQIDIQDNDGQTALDWARKKRHFQIVDILQEYQRRCPKCSKSALIHAIYFNKNNLVKKICKEEDISFQEKMAAYKLALRNGNKELQAFFENIWEEDDITQWYTFYQFLQIISTSPGDWLGYYLGYAEEIQND